MEAKAGKYVWETMELYFRSGEELGEEGSGEQLEST